tara:strand:+ start:33673 stop:34332 length:660 start_codon:yes stop_codon:yes gene_type:complete
MNNPLDFFDAIYCINLKERTDRWDRCHAEFEKFGISDRVIQFSAIKPEIDERWDRPTPWARPGYPRPGAVGCAESHKAVIELAKEQNLNNVLVLEDDFVVCENWSENLESSLNDLVKYDWHIFYLGYHLHRTWGMRRRKGRNLKEMRSKKRRGIHLTVGLAYNSTIFDYLIEDIDPFDWNKQGREGHVDKYFARNSKLKKFYAEPMILEPDWSLGTDVQ